MAAAASPDARWLHSQPQLAGNAEDAILTALRGAGFSEAQVVSREELPLASVRSYQAIKATSGGV